MKPHVTIIILNWNGWEDTIECLDSLNKINYPNYDVIIVDNHSEDDSVRKIREYCNGKLKVKSSFFDHDSVSKPLRMFEINEEKLKKLNGNKIDYLHHSKSKNNLILIKNNENRGFAEGNNIGINYALNNLNSDCILLLNNDTVVEPYFLNKLVNHAESASIVGSKLYFYDDKDLIQSTGVKIKWSYGEMISLGYGHKNNFEEYEMDLDAVSGCSMLIKKEVIDKIGFLNTKCFLYYEDTDFCVRAKRAGFKIICANDSKVWHKTSVSSKRVSGTREYYSARNLFLFMRKYANKKQFYTFLMYFIGFKFWFNSGLIIFYHREPRAFVPFVKGVLDGFKTIY
ncbi:glycosyltransferase family 2 protein [Methanobacterium congolense]|uniref:Glycosyl transferase family 2 n=1 Tax=Methanobacterium congolense TaxID=118062 RepID=A0A1D3L4A3_9EURY|nr:glycosyltransferase family 2 protein [Methanobacterium congolense]SCG86386.1 Glycosyl transferase family 2 [Methanobacterium congolense]